MPYDLIKVISGSKDIQVAVDPDKLNQEAVPFHGQLKKHRTDTERVYLLQDPLSPESLLIDFKVSDILFAEDFSTLTGPEGGSVQIAKVWVQKGAIGLRLTPFKVDDFSETLGEQLG